MNVNETSGLAVKLGHLLLFFWVVLLAAQTPLWAQNNAPQAPHNLAYLVSDSRIPFWDILRRGIVAQAHKQGDQVLVLSAANDAKTELQNMVQAIHRGVDGIILSPTNSSAAVTLLKLAKQAGIPVVIADIGTEAGDYVSFISSDNFQGSYQLGQLLAEEFAHQGWRDAAVGIIAIPQKRANGKARTAGFLQALEEHQIKVAELYQQVDFSHQETYDFSTRLIQAHPQLRAIWLQGSDRYQAALEAIRDQGKSAQIKLLCFDAEPEFIEMLQDGRLLAAGMQQPFLMGETAVKDLYRFWHQQPLEQQTRLPVLAVSGADLNSRLALIRRNVLGLGVE